MNKLKQAAYGAFSTALAAAPVAALAQWNPGASATGTGLPGNTIFNIVNATMLWLLAIVGFLGIIGFVIAGILYLTAAGDEGQIDKAKNAMMYSIIGVIVALLGFVIMNAATAFLGGGTRF